MPPLKAERQFERTPEQIASTEQVLDARRKVYDRMVSLVPEKPSKRFSSNLQSAKAIYQVEGQPEGEYTRAWLQKSVGSDEVRVLTDRVMYVGGKPTMVEDSEFMHYILGPSPNVIYSNHYGASSDEEDLELMQSTQDTLDLIEQANLAQASTA